MLSRKLAPTIATYNAVLSVMGASRDIEDRVRQKYGGT